MGVGIGAGVGVRVGVAVGTTLLPPGRTRGANGSGRFFPPAVSGNPESSLKQGVVTLLIFAQT